MEYRSGMVESCGFLYRPTWPKAVMRREPPFAFITKKEGFRYSIQTATSSGRLKISNSSSSSSFCCNSTSLSCKYWDSRPFLGKCVCVWGGLDGTHVHFVFKGARSTVAAFDFRIEYVVKLVKSSAKLNGVIKVQAVFRTEANWAGTSVSSYE